MTHASIARLLGTALVITVLAVTPSPTTAEEITLRVDAGEIHRGLVHAEIRMPVTPGALRLVYPRWGADWMISAAFSRAPIPRAPPTTSKKSSPP